MYDLKKFKLVERISMGIANLGGCLKITGAPEVLEAIIKYLENKEKPMKHSFNRLPIIVFGKDIPDNSYVIYDVDMHKDLGPQIVETINMIRSLDPNSLGLFHGEPDQYFGVVHFETDEFKRYNELETRAIQARKAGNEKEENEILEEMDKLYTMMGKKEQEMVDTI